MRALFSLAALQNLVEAFVKYTAKFVLDNHVQDLRAIQRWQDNEREVAAKQVPLPARRHLTAPWLGKGRRLG